MSFSPAGLYANVARLGGSSALAGTDKTATPQNVRSFADALAEATRRAIRTVQAGEAAAMQGVAGTMDTHQVVAAMTQAELTIQATVAIRDKMVQAYQEIMRMPV
ncbi:flagellar hook-basal body complex protein FliE [Benzoatithermus flavus]|uniref:Flagellar hook-basal body complex protein FliE n=1 Tax=Benzoatithermus flavus TaxID=3108223 RepID=A0ABU8XV93_9PROT